MAVPTSSFDESATGDAISLPVFARLISDMSTGLTRDAAARLRIGQPSAAGFPVLTWGRQFLAAHIAKPSSAMHEWLEWQLEDLHKRRGSKINLIGPRGSAKSTIVTLCYVLQAAVEGWEPYIWIISDTQRQAQTHLENVKAELVENRQLARDYPFAVGPFAVGRGRGGGRRRRWQECAIELANGVVIESYGTGQRIRGRRRRAHRPTLIVCDDLQNDSHISSALQRESSRSWFHGTLLKAGTSRTNVVNLATALHRDALALELDQTAGWASARFSAIVAWPTNIELWDEWEALYTGGGERGTRSEGERQGADAAKSNELGPDVSLSAAGAAREFYERHRVAMDAGAVVLWPEEEDLYTLMQMRVESGRTAFEREKQGSPVDPELCEWPESYFEDHIWFDEWPADLVIKTMALDPSKGGDARRGDYSAYVMLGIDAAGFIHVEADLARRPTPQMIADGAALCQRFRPVVLGVEANQYQELLAGEIAAEFRRQAITHTAPAAMHNYVNKLVRIRRLGPLLSQRRLCFLRGSAGTRLLVDQLRDFPAGAHDDGPDALEMALRLADEIWHGRNASDGLGERLISI
jgi:predicted phage terminase large subunit-like protein